MRAVASILIVFTVLIMIITLAGLSTAESNIDLLVIIGSLCFLAIMLRIWQAMLFQAINHGGSRERKSARQVNSQYDHMKGDYFDDTDRKKKAEE